MDKLELACCKIQILPIGIVEKMIQMTING